MRRRLHHPGATLALLAVEALLRPSPRPLVGKTAGPLLVAPLACSVAGVQTLRHLVADDVNQTFEHILDVNILLCRAFKKLHACIVHKIITQNEFISIHADATQMANAGKIDDSG